MTRDHLPLLLSLRLAALTVALVGVTGGAPTAVGQVPDIEDQPPARYELIIDGENFTIEENRLTTLQSRKRPDTKFQVAIRFAQFQPWRLNDVGFDYHEGFAIRDDRGEDIRTATLRHRLGFVLTLADLGGELDAAGAKRALDLLVRAATASIDESRRKELLATPRSSRKFGSNAGLGVVLDHERGGVPERTLAWVLRGDGYACTAVAQYVRRDEANILPLLKPTLESLAPLTDDRAPPPGRGAPSPAD